MNRFIFLIFFLLIGLTSSAQMISQLNPYPVKVQQHGVEFQIQNHGNYYKNWHTTNEGVRVIWEKNQWQYAVEENGQWKAAGIPLQKEMPEKIRSVLAVKSAKLEEPLPYKTPALVSENGIGGLPTEGNVRIPVICVEFSDLEHTRSTDEIQRMFNQEDYKGNICLAEYFKMSSHGKLNMTFDVFGWVSTKTSHTLYADSKGMYHAGKVARKAIVEANAAGADFSQYDNDNDGEVDCVMILHAGLGAEEVGDDRYIWAHSWSLSGTGIGALQIDGKEINAYNIGCELRKNNEAGIGMKCHELGHALGLPDLYDGTGSSNGLGHWCMMSAGPWLNEARPANFSAWCRVQLGWDSLVVKDYAVKDTFLLASTSEPNQVVRINTLRENEYFLLENRQKQGIDYRLPGTGLAIYHCDAQKLEAGLAINDDKYNPGIRMMEADFKSTAGLFNAKDRGTAGDLFPGTTEKTEFGATTTPSSNFFDGGFSGVHLANISESEGIISMQIKGVVPRVMWQNSVFRESPENKGEIVNRVDLELLGTIWNTSEDFLAEDYFNTENIPAGLTPEIEIIDSTHAALVLIGMANNHEGDNSLENLNVSITDSAFILGESQVVEHASKADLAIRFRDEYEENTSWKEGFELYDVNEMPDGWIIESEQGMSWKVASNVTISCDVASFFCRPSDGGRALASQENWFDSGPATFRLITPKIDLSENVNPKLFFDEIRGWDNVWPTAKANHGIDVEFSTNKENWTKLATVSFNQSNFESWQKSQMVSLADFSGQEGYIAFKSSSHSYYWELDEVKIVSGGTGLEEHRTLETQIFPNPSDGKLWVKSNSQLKYLRLFNLTGTELFHTLAAGNVHEINLKNYPKGMYILWIQNQNGSTEAHKVQLK